MFSLLKKEIRSYFITPIGYVFVAVYLAVNGVLFTNLTLKATVPTTSVDAYFTTSILALVLLVPLLTMRSFSEERKMKTDQLLLTAPISLASMVGAKLLGAYVVYSLTVVASAMNMFALVIISLQLKVWAVLLISVLLLLLTSKDRHLLITLNQHSNAHNLKKRFKKTFY